MRRSKLSLVVVSFAAHQVCGHRWPSPQFDQLEGLLYEKVQEFGDGSLSGIMEGCVLNANESTPAEWVRFVCVSKLDRHTTAEILYIGIP